MESGLQTLLTGPSQTKIFFLFCNNLFENLYHEIPQNATVNFRSRFLLCSGKPSVEWSDLDNVSMYVLLP